MGSNAIHSYLHRNQKSWWRQRCSGLRDATTTHRHSDRKALRKEREKKIALGHKEDDHEEKQIWEQKM